LLGLPMNPSRLCTSRTAAVQAASEFGRPVVMKTAMPGIAHKTEQGGVHLDLGTAEQVRAAWDDLSKRLGQRVLVAPMVPADGLEMVLGMVHDEQFGPLVMLGFGGTRLEALRDVVFAMPPFDADTAQRLLMRLRQRALFDFDRGQGRPDLAAFCATAALFSTVVASLADQVEEIDLNPIIVNAQACVAVDALVIPAGARQPGQSRRKAS